MPLFNDKILALYSCGMSTRDIAAPLLELYDVEVELDLSVFEARYHNDDTGAPAFGPSVLLKIVIYAYSLGITSSRRIEQACRENIIFMALSADTQPHFTTIASFISTMDQQIVPLFRNVLLICNELKLVGGDMSPSMAANCPATPQRAGAEPKPNSETNKRNWKKLPGSDEKEDRHTGRPLPVQSKNGHC